MRLVAALLELLADPAFVVDGGGIVKVHNSAGTGLIEDSRVGLSSTGQLVLRGTRAARHLSSQISVCCASGRSQLDGFKVEGPDSRELSVAIFPLMSEASGDIAAKQGRNICDALVVFSVERTINSLRAPPQSVRGKFTPTERRVADKLKDGCDLKSAAAELGISYQTARTHLRSLFAKMDVHRQSDLVRRLLTEDKS
ncbi:MULTISPECIES: helix-turn-helix transcriptional regulator [unclassified Chelatococcus]|uniref:helix-turn-helix transcriptional regulator n=1 Tax=unclassified Chelatococcus TaxID=2638111 RepID=UPI001BCBBABC|nr:MULTISPECIES: helix-turn-helix transcriptional regulator [unclassified Chelatococcus]MBS7743726.1 helix-turn-helix transcriptional regulator [Chelatococcus sp. HY11]MBX3547432.1 helix-turn-helix transcriptional regulator [Chelatococcus sp.]